MFNKGMMNWLSLVIAVFVLLFLVIIFGMFDAGTIQSININVQNVEKEIDSTNMLIRFLNSPYNDENIKSFLTESYYQSDFDDLGPEVKQFLDPFYEEAKKSWRLKITEQPGDDEVAKFIGDNFAKCEGLRSLLAECKKIVSIASLKLAVKNEDVDYLQLELSLAQLK